MKKTLFLIFLILSSIFFSCNDDNEKNNLVEIGKGPYLSLEQGENNLGYHIVEINDNSRSDTLLVVGLILQNNNLPSSKKTTVDLLIDSDSLKKAISLSESGNQSYQKYKNTQLLPSKYYNIPKSINIDTNKNKGYVYIKIDKQALLQDERSFEENFNFVLPLRITNSNSYQICNKQNFLMIFFKFQKRKLENIIYLEFAKNLIGKERNLTFEITEKAKADTLINVGVGLESNHTEETKPFTVDLIIDIDTLEYILKQAEAGNSSYKQYKNSRILPKNYYFMPTKIEVTDNKKRGETSLYISQSELLKDDFILTENAQFLLPLRIVNSSNYDINIEESFVILAFKFPNHSFDPTVPDPSEAPQELKDMRLIFNEEFNYEGKPNPNIWSFEHGFARNQELQWYQDDNAICKNGALIITGRKERVKNPYYQVGSGDWKKNREYAEYTSTSITTSKSFNFKYGTLLVRAKIPTARGAWPAIWTVGNWWEWPLGGEIDVLEYYLAGGVPSIHANVCWGSDRRWNGRWDSYNRPLSTWIEKDPDWTNKYHIWKMDWDKNFIRLYLDDELLNEIDLNKTVNGGGGEDWLEGRYENPFSNTFGGFGQYILLNLALGSNGGRPDDSAFPLQYFVDYVRVYQ